jgi:hypothetical protein
MLELLQSPALRNLPKSDAEEMARRIDEQRNGWQDSLMRRAHDSHDASDLRVTRNGFRIRSDRSMSRPSCMSSESSVVQPASSAAAAIMPS